MNKKQVVDSVAKCADVSQATAREVIDCYYKVISGALKKEKKVKLFGIGSLSIYKRRARTGRNPQTGQLMRIPAKNAVRFKVSGSLKFR
ncbi:MAG TPA: HU family DNA-binding protein [Acidobacteriota bacterium]|nr:HU family DNA-binding protein [Acidobacteriota bacterium]